jgi:hypothetical protein
VEGTIVYDPRGSEIGSIKRLMIDKVSGRVCYAVMSFGGLLGMGTEEHAVPWNKLTYDTNLGGYRTDITEQELRGAPTFSRDRNFDWNDRLERRSCTITTALAPTGACEHSAGSGSATSPALSGGKCAVRCVTAVLWDELAIAPAN